MNKMYMLDTNICSFIMREQPEAVLKRPSRRCCGSPHCGFGHHRAEVSLASQEAGPAAQKLADAFAARLDAILPRDRTAVDATTEIKVALRLAGTPIGPNDTAIAGHAIAAGAVLVTNNVREFERVPGLVLEDWVR